jgi:hypothetical protein
MTKGRHLVPAFFFWSSAAPARRICMATMCEPERESAGDLAESRRGTPGRLFRR